jgi:hypothetical protein
LLFQSNRTEKVDSPLDRVVNMFAGISNDAVEHTRRSDAEAPGSTTQMTHLLKAYEDGALACGIAAVMAIINPEQWRGIVERTNDSNHGLSTMILALCDASGAKARGRN